MAADPDDETRERRFLAMQKHNLRAPVRSLTYHVETTPVGVPYVAWDDPTDHNANQLLAMLPADVVLRRSRRA